MKELTDEQIKTYFFHGFQKQAKDPDGTYWGFHFLHGHIKPDTPTNLAYLMGVETVLAIDTKPVIEAVRHLEKILKHKK